MIILFAAGGSGGHINPALAMAEIIQKNVPHTRCFFGGRRDSMENAAALREGYPFLNINIEGLPRKISCQSIKSVFKAFSSINEAKKILLREKINLVIGTGGYVSFPFIKAARSLRIPVILFEANAIPGLAFKLCERSADAILLQFEECRKHLRFPEKARVIGAPLRHGFTSLSKNEARARLGIAKDAFFFLSFGGSLGAQKINEVCIGLMKKSEKQEMLHIHACGARYYEELKKKAPRCADEGRLLPYLEEMPLYMAAADLVLCRAGAITLAELARAGRAAILVPSPNVTADHQRKNAYAYGERGAAIVFEEKDLSDEILFKTVMRLKGSPPEIRVLEQKIKELDYENAEREFLRTVLSLTEKK